MLLEYRNQSEFLHIKKFQLNKTINLFIPGCGHSCQSLINSKAFCNNITSFEIEHGPEVFQSSIEQT